MLGTTMLTWLNHIQMHNDSITVQSERAWGGRRRDWRSHYDVREHGREEKGINLSLTHSWNCQSLAMASPHPFPKLGFFLSPSLISLETSSPPLVSSPLSLPQSDPSPSLHPQLLLRNPRRPSSSQEGRWSLNWWVPSMISRWGWSPPSPAALLASSLPLSSYPSPSSSRSPSRPTGGLRSRGRFLWLLSSLIFRYWSLFHWLKLWVFFFSKLNVWVLVIYLDSVDCVWFNWSK